MEADNQKNATIIEQPKIASKAFKKLDTKCILLELKRSTPKNHIPNIIIDVINNIVYVS